MSSGWEDEEARAARFAQALGERSLTWLSKEIGAAVSTVSSYAKGKSPSGVVAWRIATVLGIDLVWYLTGIESSAPIVRESDVVRIPRLVGIETVGAVSFDLADLRAMGVDHQRAFVMTVGGKAMDPTIPGGSDVLVVRGGDVLDGEPHAVSLGGTTVIRRLQALPGSGWLAVCDNQAFPAQAIEGTDDVIGRVALSVTRFGSVR